MAEATKLLLVDDDPELRELIGDYLTKQGFDVKTAGNGQEMDDVLQRHRIDLVLLDLMLPGEDGLSIAKRIKRTEGFPIIMISAQGQDVDRIVGLEIGADDYLGKPFNPRELLARIRAVMRRTQMPPAGSETVEFGEFILDRKARRLTQAGDYVQLTSGEFDLLGILVDYPDTVMDRDKILDLLTGAERSPFDRSIDVRITRLRSKIETDPSAPAYIRTIWGRGYMFCPDAT
ncbi:MAG: response regulator [Pseudomonadota bacterium]|nr:response regulator [Pseudomonadota bacterium]